MNSVRNETHKTEVVTKLCGVTDVDKVIITQTQVSCALKQMKHGKSCGLDGLAAEHFIFADRVLCVLLSLLYTSMLSHGYLPAEFMLSAIIPVFKN